MRRHDHQKKTECLILEEKKVPKVVPPSKETYTQAGFRRSHVILNNSTMT